MKTSYSSLREEWKRANLPNDHPVKSELDSCRKTLTTLGADVASAKDKSDSHSTTSSTSSFSPERSCCGNSKSDLPTIDVPTLHGSILEWNTFWASFQSTIDNRKDLSNTKKLHYLRQAVKDSDVQLLLHSPTETPDMYVEVVQELKERFNKTREIHRHLTKTFLQMPSPKQTRVDLRRMVDSVKRTMDSIKATKYYDLDSFLSSLVYLILPPRLQTLWDQHSKKDKGVPPVTQLLGFIREHAETLPSTATSTQPSSEKPGENSAKKPPRKSDRKQDYQSSKPRSNVHTVSPAPSYKWECRPDKHPLHSCPKWSAYNVTQRLGHIQAKSLCSVKAPTDVENVVKYTIPQFTSSLQQPLLSIPQLCNLIRSQTP